MSMRYNSFYGISLRQYFGNSFIEKLKEISEDVEEVYENFHLVDEFDNNSDIAIGIFVEGLSISETEEQFSEYIKDDDLNQIITKIILEAKKCKIDVNLLEEIFLEKKDKNYIPKIMSVYI